MRKDQISRFDQQKEDFEPLVVVQKGYQHLVIQTNESAQ